MYQRKLRQYLSNRMVLEGEHSSIVYLLDTNYIYIYTVIYLYSIDNMQREREAVTHTYYHSISSGHLREMVFLPSGIK